MTDIAQQPSFYQQQQVNDTANNTHNPVANYTWDKEALKTRSTYHQFLDYKDRVILKRYVKSSVGSISFVRQHPLNSRQRLQGLLMTDDNEGWWLNEMVKREYRDEISTVQLYRYESDVIELYEGIDSVDIFERWNEQALNDGTLAEYEDGAVYKYDNGTGYLVEVANGMATTRKPAILTRG